MANKFFVEFCPCPTYLKINAINKRIYNMGLYFLFPGNPYYLLSTVLLELVVKEFILFTRDILTLSDI